MAIQDDNELSIFVEQVKDDFISSVTKCILTKVFSNKMTFKK